MSRDPQTPEEGSADGFTWAERAELHQRIMNLRADQAGLQPSPLRLAYRDGHRDARHAAAELVAALPVASRPSCREGGSIADEDVANFTHCPYCGESLVLRPAEETTKP